MAFDQTVITSGPTITPLPGDVEIHVGWTSSAAAGTYFQVYVNRTLAYHGTARECYLAWPSEVSVLVQVGAVLATEATKDLSATLPSPFASSGDRCQLAWIGGRYLDDFIKGFQVFASPAPGAPVDTTDPVADIPVYLGNQVLDGAGRGGAGRGGAGRAATSYTWTSDQLAAGVWLFQVRAYDIAGNLGPAVQVSFTSVAPPAPPAPFADHLRLHHTFDQPSSTATLLWNLSPG